VKEIVQSIIGWRGPVTPLAVLFSCQSLPDGWTNGINGPIILQDTNLAGATQRFYRAQATSVNGP